LEDVLAWKGGNFTDFLLSVVGGMASFAYLKFKSAKPPCMVYWGANPKYLMKDLAEIIGFKEKVIEGRSFEFTFSRLKDFINNDQPVMAGALDMYYLHYYPDLYKKQHVPLHYMLVVGYDDEPQIIYEHDCGYQAVQKIPYDEFKKSLDVNVSGMSKKNTMRAFILPPKLPTEYEVAKKGFRHKAERFLNPPVKLFGIPAMRKLAKEIFEWNNKKCFEHVATYATAPPLLPTSFENSHGMRLWQASLLRTLGTRYKIDQWNEASSLFKTSGEKIMKLCEAALSQDKQQISKTLLEIADIEEHAYKLLKKV